MPCNKHLALESENSHQTKVIVYNILTVAGLRDKVSSPLSNLVGKPNTGYFKLRDGITI